MSKFVTVECEACGKRQTFRSEASDPSVDIMTQINADGWKDTPDRIAALCPVCTICPDCGEPNEMKGHMGCQYPS